MFFRLSRDRKSVWQEVCLGPTRDGTHARWSRPGGIRATLMQCVRSGRFKPEFVRRLLVTFWIAFWCATMRSRLLALRR